MVVLLRLDMPDLNTPQMIMAFDFGTQKWAWQSVSAIWLRVIVARWEPRIEELSRVQIIVSLPMVFSLSTI